MITSDIIEATARYYGISEDEILSDRRFVIRTEARHIVMYLARELTRETLREIGRTLGDRHHSSVIHGSTRIERDLRIPRIATAVERVRAILLTRDEYRSVRIRAARFGVRAS